MVSPLVVLVVDTNKIKVQVAWEARGDVLMG